MWRFLIGGEKSSMLRMGSVENVALDEKFAHFSRSDADGKADTEASLSPRMGGRCGSEQRDQERMCMRRACVFDWLVCRVERFERVNIACGRLFQDAPEAAVGCSAIVTSTITRLHWPLGQLQHLDARRAGRYARANRTEDVFSVCWPATQIVVNDQ